MLARHTVLFLPPLLWAATLAGCDADQACTTVAIPAVRVTVACDKLPALGPFELMSKRSSDATLKPCIGRIPLSCNEAGEKVVVDCGPYSDPGKSPKGTDYVVSLTQGDFLLEVTMFVPSDACHPDTVSIALP